MTTNETFTISVILPGQADSRPLITVPVQDVVGFSVTPLKWLRYCAGVILGSEGHLQVVPDDPASDPIRPDYDERNTVHEVSFHTNGSHSFH